MNIQEIDQMRKMRRRQVVSHCGNAFCDFSHKSTIPPRQMSLK